MLSFINEFSLKNSKPLQKHVFYILDRIFINSLVNFLKREQNYRAPFKIIITLTKFENRKFKRMEIYLHYISMLKGKFKNIFKLP